MGGSIAAANRTDRTGAVFTIRLPVPVTSKLQAEAIHDATRGPLRILVVDDEPAILRFLHASLESQGYIVATAADAHTALDMVRRHTADLVVLDLGLPDMDGLDVVRQIRDGGENLPIIILSSREKKRQGQSVRSWRRRLCHKTFRYR